MRIILSREIPKWSGRTGMPPRVLLEPLIEPQPAPFDHWYWGGEFNVRCEARIRWAAGGYKSAWFGAARVLIHHDKGPIAPRSRVSSVCGLRACVNPMHWLVQTHAEWLAQDHRIVVVSRSLYYDADTIPEPEIVTPYFPKARNPRNPAFPMPRGSRLPRK